MLRFEFVDSLTQLDELAPAWQSLSQRADGPWQFFQNWHWVRGWWTTLAPTGNYRLRVLIATLDGEIVMIWPWAIRQRRGLRVLEPVGGLFSCFDDALITPSALADGVLERAWAVLLQTDGVDAIELRAVHQNANIAPLLQTVGGTALATTAAPDVDLTEWTNFDAYLARRSKKMRQNQRRSARALEALGTLRVSGNDTDMPVDVAINTCLEFKQQWLRARGLSGKHLMTDESLVFLREVGQHYRDADDGPDICVSSVVLDDRPISIGIGFRFKQVHFEYLGGFDYTLEHAGAGRVRMEYGLRDSFEQRLHSYNMLTPATAFKRIWTDRSPAVHHYVIAGNVRGTVYRDLYLRKLRPQLKRVYNKIPAPLRGRIGTSR